MFLLLFGTLLLPAASFNVTNLLDDGSPGSLRWAINQANANGSGSDDINVMVSGTVLLLSDLPNLTSTVNISGNDLIIDGDNLYSAFKIATNINDMPVLNATISNLIIRNCSDSNGSALYIYQAGSVVEVNNCTFTSNTSSNDGGAIWSRGQLTINNSSFNSNSAISDDGGAILTNDGNLEINESTFDTNFANDAGGAINIENGGIVTINKSSFFGNNALDDGGAINISDGSVTITQSLFAENDASDSGGAIRHNDGMLTIENTTFSKNEGNNGGAMRVTGGSAELSSVTMVNNSADNRGGGFRISSGANLEVGNSIIALNSASSLGQDVFNEGTLTSNGFNIVQVDDQNHFTPLVSDMEGIDPLVGPLAENGGPTMTHGLMVGSPAIDNGGNCLTVDQRDFPRAAVNCSIGAFEGQLAMIPTLNQWGIILLTLLLLILSTLSISTIRNSRLGLNE